MVPTQVPETRIGYAGKKPSWTELVHTESIGSNGHIGISIFGLGVPADLTDDERWAFDKQASQMSELLCAYAARRDPARAEAALKEFADIVALFDQPIFVERIPNGYCSRYCCEHKPWFNITTKIGHIQIGWRKRVINIDWSRTAVAKTGDELFPNENVTRGDRYIHAYGYEKAREYIRAITSAAENA